MVIATARYKAETLKTCAMGPAELQCLMCLVRHFVALQAHRFLFHYRVPRNKTQEILSNLRSGEYVRAETCGLRPQCVQAAVQAMTPTRLMIQKARLCIPTASH